MKCNTEIHNEMITMEYIDCPFCDQQLQQPSTIYLSCCEKQDMVNNKGTNVFRNCGIVDSYSIASKYVDFHENKYKIVKKSVYHRKYHLENVINDICSKYKLQISVYDLTKIHQVFREIDKILPLINGDRKRMININFILKQLFEMLNIPCNNIPITKSKKTLDIYEQYWKKIRDIIQP